MNLKQIEEHREELSASLQKKASSQRDLFLISRFYRDVLSSEMPAVKESYILEFLGAYINALKYYSAFGSEPEITENILKLAEKISDLKLAGSYKNEIDEIIKAKKLELNDLKLLLEGKSFERLSENKPRFPLIENINLPGYSFPGILDSVTINLKEIRTKDKFIIVPSERVIEENIIAQVKDSWKSALMFSKKYLRKHAPAHEVIISFDKRIGFYEGRSLGLALFLAFTDALLQHYNSKYIVGSTRGTALTGSLYTDGRIPPIPEETIVTKTGICFYSPVNLFVVPEENVKSAEETLAKLKKLHPERELKIEEIRDLPDMVNKRNIVEIKKRKLITRAAKFIRDNAAVLSAFLLIIAAVLIIPRLLEEKNPYSVRFGDYAIHILDSSGDVLWTHESDFNKLSIPNSNVGMILIDDIDRDNFNEVIVANSPPDRNKIKAFNRDKNVIWEFEFIGDVSSSALTIEHNFVTLVHDFIQINNKKYIVSASHSRQSYPSALYLVDTESGTQITGPVWHPGHLSRAISDDFDNDGEIEIAAVGISNAYERAVFLIIEPDKLKGQAPSDKYYKFDNISPAEFELYILLPKSDFADHYNFRYPIPFHEIVFNPESGFFTITLMEYNSEANYYINYFTINPSNFEVKINTGDKFTMLRDKLITEGEIKGPLTNTAEFYEYMLDQVRYWNGEKFVIKAEYLKLKQQ